MMGSIGKLKRIVVEKLLADEDFILVVVSPQVQGVQLPQALLDAQQPVGLHLGYKLAVPIPDLVVDEEGIRATLLFDRATFFCSFPWEAVLQVSIEGEHMVWVTPPSAAEPRKTTKKPTRVPRPTPAVASTPGPAPAPSPVTAAAEVLAADEAKERDDDGDTQNDDQSAKSKSPGKGHLRLV